MVFKFYPCSGSAASLSLAGREGLCTATVGVERIEVIGNTMSGSWLDVAKSDISLEMLEVEKWIEMVCAEVVA